MRILAFILPAALLCLTASAQNHVTCRDSGADRIVRVWDNASAPHSNGESVDESINGKGNILNTSETELYIFQPSGGRSKNRGILVIPGGGFSKVCIPDDGFDMARFFRDAGYTAVVIKYRLPNLGHFEIPLEDAVEGLRYMRRNAAELGIDAGSVGLIGSSAGGYLGAYVSTAAPLEDRPAYAVLIYPVITGETWQTHQGTFRYLLGDDRTPKQTDEFSLQNRVDETTPPTMIFVGDDDTTAPSISPVLYYKALKRYGVPASLHVYPSGVHGWAGDAGYRYMNDCMQSIYDWIAINTEKK